MRSSTNYLLAKDDVGRSKPTTRDLPHSSHAFGYANRPDAVGVGGCKLLKLLKLIFHSHFCSDERVADSLDQTQSNMQR